MSFIDKILDKMSLNSEDDEEFDNEDYYLDDEEEELPRNPFRRKKEAAEEEPTIKSTRRDTTPKEKPVNIKIIQKAGIIRHGSLRNKTKFN